MKVKVIKPVNEVWSERTLEATVNVDGREITIREQETPNWSDTYVICEDEWVNINDCPDEELVRIVNAVLIDGILELDEGVEFEA